MKSVQFSKNGGDVHAAYCRGIWRAARACAIEKCAGAAKVINFGISMAWRQCAARKSRESVSREEGSKIPRGLFPNFETRSIYRTHKGGGKSSKGFTETVFRPPPLSAGDAFPGMRLKSRQIRRRAEDVSVNPFELASAFVRSIYRASPAKLGEKSERNFGSSFAATRSRRDLRAGIDAHA